MSLLRTYKFFTFTKKIYLVNFTFIIKYSLQLGLQLRFLGAYKVSVPLLCKHAIDIHTTCHVASGIKAECNCMCNKEWLMRHAVTRLQAKVTRERVKEALCEIKDSV